MTTQRGILHQLGVWLRDQLVVPDDLPDGDTRLLAIIVIPFSLTNGALGPKMTAIVDRAVELCNLYQVDNLVLTGGWESNGKKEGTLAAEAVYGRISPHIRIIVEDETLNTFAQARYLQDVVPKLEGEGRPVLILAEEMHMRRVLLLACRRLGRLTSVFHASAHSLGWDNDKWVLRHPLTFGVREVLLLALLALFRNL
ncbi:MAG TPA: ElyC/SanA/YdcF family protein [Patescibacteria group bacterium]